MGILGLGGNALTGLLTTKELCEYYKVGKQAVAKWRSMPGFPYKKLGEKTFRYDLEEVKRYFNNIKHNRAEK